MFKNKNQPIEITDEPKAKKKKKLKWILIAAAVILFLFIVGLSGSDEKIPMLGDNLSNYVELYSEEKTDVLTKQWYKIDPEEISLVEDYVDLLCDEHGFELVDGQDNDYYLFYKDGKDLKTLYTDKGAHEYHIRVGIGDEGEDRSIIAFIFVNGLFENVDNTDENADTDSEDNSSDNTTKDTEKADNSTKTDDTDGTETDTTEKNKAPGKDAVIVSDIAANTSAGQKQGKDSVKIQSMFNFAQNLLEFDKPDELNGSVNVINFEGEAKNAKVVDEYIRLLCSGGMNLKESDFVHKDYSDVYSASFDESKEWGLSYTGSASVSEKCDGITLNKSKTFAVAIYYTVNGKYLEGFMYWSADLNPCDLGFRSGGKNVSSAYGGKSAYTGLIRKADGSFRTKDGRFSAGLNEVVICSNGKTQKGSLEYVDNSPKGGDELKIRKGDGSKLLTVIFPRSAVQKTGMMFGYNDLIQEFQFPLSGDPYGDLGEDTIVYQFNGSKWITATYSDSSCKDMTLRVVYYNEAEQVAVYYIYTKYTSETEVFCVVDLSNATRPGSQNSSGGGSGSGIPPVNNGGSKLCAVCKNKGKIFCNRCNGTGKIVISGSVAGFGTGNGSFKENKGDCPECDGGYKKCSYCN